jgi:hypothetical protein
MNRCLWCNGSEGELRTVALHEGKQRHDVLVHPAHEASLVGWHARVAGDTPRFVTIVAFTPMLLLAAVGVAALVSRASTLVVVGLAVIALAAFIWRHPHATPQTVRLLGVRRSITVVRLITTLTALLGVWTLAAGFAALRG